MSDEMQRLTQDDLRRIQLDILDYVAAFCDAHGIRYWLTCGTLLGAIRHQGYIPWDDDIDVGMLRSDFARFLEAFGQERDGGRYYVICNELDPTCPYAYAKVLDRQTVLYEPDENGPRLRVNIDVFVYDNAPADARESERMYRVRDLYRSMNLLQNRMIGGHGVVKDFVTFWGYHILRHWAPGRFATRVAENARRYAGQETGYVGNYTSFKRIHVAASVFDAYVDVPFEGRMYHAPVGFDAWLRAFYGAYMQLPPEERRVSHHMFVGYLLEDMDGESVSVV